MPLIATAGEQARCGHWPILRKRGRGDTVASLRFALTEESKLFLTRLGRSSASAKSAGLDLPTGSVVGHTHTSTTIKTKPDKQMAHVHGRWQVNAVVVLCRKCYHKQIDSKWKKKRRSIQDSQKQHADAAK